jgi:hypothetical protein
MKNQYFVRKRGGWSLEQLNITFSLW